MEQHSAKRDRVRSHVGLLVLAVASAALAWGDFRLAIRSADGDFVLRYEGLAHLSVDIGQAR